MRTNGERPNLGNRQVGFPQPASSAPVLFYLEPVAAEPAPKQDRKKSFFDYFYLARQGKIALLVCTLAGLAAAVLVTSQVVPMYRAQATLEVRTVKTAGTLLEAPDGDGSRAEARPDLETQIQILESDMLAQRVQAKLRSENAARTYQAHDIFAGWRRRPASELHSDVAGRPRMPAVNTTAAVLGNSRILQITCESGDSDLAADYANALAGEYIQYNFESTSHVGTWLNQQVREARDQLEQSENQLQAYMRQANLVYTGDDPGDSAEQKKLRQLQEDLAKATADRMIKQAAMEVAKSSSLEAVPAVVDNARLSGYQSKLAELRREYAQLSSTFTDSHYKVAGVLAQIHEVEATIERERRDILDRIRNNYEEARSVERMLGVAYSAQLPQASDTARKGIQYGLMKAEVETNRSIYQELLRRVKGMSIGSTLQANNTAVLDRATAPAGPFLPNLTRNLSAGAGLGLVLGVFIVFIREFINRNFNAPGEAPFHLGVPELGVIPMHEAIVGDRVTARLPKMLSIAARAGNGSDSGSAELVTWEDGPSLMAEAYRGTLASILLSPAGGIHPQVILVTSPGRGEGKSTTVSNLGIALAEINQEVILIDADLRRPSLHATFKIANTWGLSDILREKTWLKDSPLVALAKPTSMEGLHLLPSGPGTASISNLLYSDRMWELIDRLRREFDTIIIDTPPISSVSDARIVGRVADSAILVIRAGMTTRDAAMAAKQRLKDDGIPLLGTVLNAWDGKATSRYGYAYGSYPHGRTTTDQPS